MSKQDELWARIRDITKSSTERILSEPLYLNYDGTLTRQQAEAIGENLPLGMWVCTETNVRETKKLVIKMTEFHTIDLTFPFEFHEDETFGWQPDGDES